MKKSLLALAVLSAFAGVASAQSSITLYGRVDAGYSRFDPDAGTATDISATSALTSGNLGGSRWGIRGSEDLGGGLRGVFVLESGFNMDDGTSGQGGRLFGRQAYMGLTGGWGGLVMGRIPSFSSGTGDFDKFGSLDPFRTGASILGWQATMSSANSLRLDNAVAYVTPNMGGFSAGIGYTFRQNGGAENAGGANANNAGYVAYANFSSGPFYAVVTYDAFKLGEIDAGTGTGLEGPFAKTDPKQDHLQIGASWDFKVIKLSAAYVMEENQFAAGPAGVGFSGAGYQNYNCTQNVVFGGTCITTQAPGSDATAWAVGAIIPFGAHRINASYQSRSVDSFVYQNGTTGANVTAGEANRSVWALGYEYSFSRRTTLYVYYGDVSDKDAYRQSNWGGGSQTFLGLSHTF